MTLLVEGPRSRHVSLSFSPDFEARLRPDLAPKKAHFKSPFYLYQESSFANSATGDVLCTYSCHFSNAKTASGAS